MHFAFLGTSGAVPSLGRDTTSLVFVARDAVILVDCGGSPVQKLRAAAVDPRALTHVIITHIHADHAYGLPALVQTLFLLGRSAPLPVFCRPEHVGPLSTVLELFQVQNRKGIFPVDLTGITVAEHAELFRTPSFTVTASPNEHGAMENFAVRVDVPARGVGIVYSSDTLPCEAVVRLATGADTLVHEATFPQRDRGRFGAHSTAAEAGGIASRAGVRRLLLAHIEADYHDELDALADEARSTFGGEVEIAQELVPYPI
jgi:ribonuclease Z